LLLAQFKTADAEIQFEKVKIAQDEAQDSTDEAMKFQRALEECQNGK